MAFGKFQNATMKIAMILTILLGATISWAQSDAEEVAIRKILDEEVAAWNKGDADAYSRHFASDGTFTNLLGMFFQGREAFRERHEQIFSGAYRASTKQLDVVSLKFVRPDVAIVETLQTAPLSRNSSQVPARMQKGDCGRGCCRCW